MSHFPRFVSEELRPFFRMLEDPFFRPHATVQDNRRAFQPRFDVHETKDEYELFGELPGLSDKQSIDIHFIDAQTLVVKGAIGRSRPYGGTPTALEEGADSSRAAAIKDGNEEKQGGKSVENGPQDVLKAEDRGTKTWVSERISGEFQRVFTFPANIDQEAVKASLKDGILSISVPKQKIERTRKITIE